MIRYFAYQKHYTRAAYSNFLMRQAEFSLSAIVSASRCIYNRLTFLGTYWGCSYLCVRLKQFATIPTARGDIYIMPGPLGKHLWPKVPHKETLE